MGHSNGQVNKRVLTSSYVISMSVDTDVLQKLQSCSANWMWIPWNFDALPAEAFGDGSVSVLQRAALSLNFY